MQPLPRMVDTPAALAEMVDALRGRSRIALDTESNAFHAYRPRVCLIQIAAGGRVWAVDTLAVTELGGLRDLFLDGGAEKILHAADGDLLNLRRDFDAGMVNIFDTMLAARLLGYPRFGLADLLQRHFNVTLDKRFQRHDWGSRPLPAPALRYAAEDVRHLERLRDVLGGELVARERDAEAAEVFERVSRVMPEERAFDPESFWRIKAARDLSSPGRAILRELYIFRDGRARAQDRPPVKVMNDEALVALSKQAPADLPGLRRSGLSPLQVDRYGHGLLQAIRRGRQASAPSLPRPSGGRPDPLITLRYDILRAWRKTRAAERGIDPEMVISNAAIRALSRARPRTVKDVAEIADLGPWKTGAYAADLLETLRGAELE
jgi:ribonuclease D